MVHARRRQLLEAAVALAQRRLHELVVLVPSAHLPADAVGALVGLVPLRGQAAVQRPIKGELKSRAAAATITATAMRVRHTIHQLLSGEGPVLVRPVDLRVRLQDSDACYSPTRAAAALVNDVLQGLEMCPVEGRGVGHRLGLAALAQESVRCAATSCTLACASGCCPAPASQLCQLLLGAVGQQIDARQPEAARLCVVLLDLGGTPHEEREAPLVLQGAHPVGPAVLAEERVEG
mmetsp:Transcript_60041/g.170734  ORF Transcript_60041/g.170734 Transcript_60041/m.170734 type:complete len:235 (-) Transcript_60041:237-941(-)